MELLVYKASAGSGKTFRLAVEYIKHLIGNPKSYKQILAVTFTNKATTEMKERILQQLYGIWKADPDSDAYLNCIRESFPDLPEEELRHRAGVALQYMLHDYNRFRVETIDSFFQSVMRNLARELELSPNLNIELNNEEVLDTAVDSLIEKLTPTSPVLKWLLDYIKERIANDKRWNVSDEIKSFGRNIFDESYIERGEKLRLKLQNPDYIRLYKAAMEELATDALEQMKGFYDQFESELESHDLCADDLKGGSRSIGSYFRKLRDGRLCDKDVLNTVLESALAGAENWATKTSKRKTEIIQLAQDSLLPILRTAEEMRPSRNQTVNSAKLSIQHLEKLQLLNHIDEEVRWLNHEHNRFLLSDTNALLHRLVGEGDSSFVFEKLGANIQNVMIDEFQDTSRMQWENFRLLLLEGLSQGADSLIVGDVKQSIYRWRNGDWSILNNLGKREAAAEETAFFTLNSSLIRVETLTVNRRSEANIIHFNNHIFQQAVSYLNQKQVDELNEECLPLKEAYADVAQESPKKENKGYVKVSFLKESDDDSYTEITLKSLGEEVERLLASGVQLSDMAILVRKNKTIPAIAEYFDKQLQINVVSNEAFRLDASDAVLALIQALKLLANPCDKIAAYALGQLIQHPIPQDFPQLLDKLKLMPLYELLEELYQLLQLNQLPGQEAYLFAFFDSVTEYLQDHSSDVDLFLTHWEDSLAKKTISSGELDGIRILSIHQSKGLEYHTVLIPFCDWKMENEVNNQLVWCAPSAAPYNSLDLVPVNYSSTMAESIYRDDYLKERLQLWVDNLNLLYVAFTRAGKNLIVWSKKDQTGTMAELLFHALPNVAAEVGGTWDNDEQVFESGTLCASQKKERQTKTPSRNKLIIQATQLPVQMESHRYDVEFRQSNRSADFIAGISEEEAKARFIDRGRLLHTLFAAIHTLDDVDDAITRLVFEGVIESGEQADEIRELTHRALSHPKVKDWYSGSWELYNECEIIWMEEGKLCQRRPDRVMMRPQQIVVVDFKFGKPRASYIRQVHDYMNLLVQMGYEPAAIKGYLWYVDEENVVEVTK